jgi:hypothetical protein
MSALVASSLRSSKLTVWDVADKDHSSALLSAVRHVRSCSFVGSASWLGGRVSVSLRLEVLVGITVGWWSWTRLLAVGYVGVGFK